MTALVRRVIQVTSIKALNSCHQHGIHSPVHMMIGMPGENSKTIRETSEFIKTIVQQLMHDV